MYRAIASRRPAAMPAPSCPLPLRLVPTSDPTSFLTQPPGTTGLPLLPHPGAFGFQRPRNVQTGVHLYCASGTPICAIDAGRVVSVFPFTGSHCQMPWWLNTWAVLVEGASGVLAYCNLRPSVGVGESVAPGTFIGQVLPALREGRGRPTSRLHMEMHTGGTRECSLWMDMNSMPSTLIDPTPTLLSIAGLPANSGRKYGLSKIKP